MEVRNGLYLHPADNWFDPERWDRQAERELKEEKEQIMLDQVITDEQVLTANNTDVLAATQLDQPGVPGVYTIWSVSDQVDSTITITLGGRRIANAAVMVQRAVSEIREDQDPYFQVLSRTGGRPVISITEVTAAVMRVRTKFLPRFAT